MSVLKRNNVNIKGEGTQPMMFAHGFGCDQNMWRFVTPAFEKDYRIILFDYVGAGKSELSAYNSERYNDLNGYAEDVLEICQALDLKDVVFVGHSVSSMIGVLAAIKEPSIFTKLIMVGPSPRYINEAPGYVGGFEKADIDGLIETMDNNYLGWASAITPVIMGADNPEELTDELNNSFCSTDPVIAKQFAKVTFYSDNRADLPRLSVDSLILQCSNDVIAPNEVGEYMHKQIPNSTFKLLQATGHCPHMSAPEETISAIREYLRP